MSEKVIIMSFESESKAFQAFSEIKSLHTQGIIEGEQMAVLKHVPNHKLEPVDFIDFTGRDKNAKAGLIGLVIGILGGPLGMLLGWFTGSVIGNYQDVKEVQGALSIFDETIKLIPEGTTGAILIAKEEKIGDLNDLIMKKLNGNIKRLDRTIVEDDVSEALEAEKEAGERAKKRWNERNKNKDENEDQKKDNNDK